MASPSGALWSGAKLVPLLADIAVAIDTHVDTELRPADRVTDRDQVGEATSSQLSTSLPVMIWLPKMRSSREINSLSPSITSG